MNIKVLLELFFTCFIIISCNTSHELTRDEAVVVSTSEQASASKVQTSSSLDSSISALLMQCDSIVLEYESGEFPATIHKHMLSVGDNDTLLVSNFKDSTQASGTKRPRDLLQSDGTHLKKMKFKVYGLNLNHQLSDVKNTETSIHDTVCSVSVKDSSSIVKENDKSSTKSFSFFHLLGALVTLVMLLALIAYIVYFIKR